MPILAYEPVRMWSSFTRCCINLKAADYLPASSLEIFCFLPTSLLIGAGKSLEPIFDTRLTYYSSLPGKRFYYDFTTL